MPEYLAPGVYVEEVEMGGKPIEGVSTSTTAFIGGAQKGPVLEPTLVTSWSQFEATFGSFIRSPRIHLAYAVDAFFRNGGKRAYIVRVAYSDAKKAFYDVKNTDTSDLKTLFRVEALNVGVNGNAIEVTTELSHISEDVGIKTLTTIVTDVKDTNEIEVKDVRGFTVGDTAVIFDNTTRVSVKIDSVNELANTITTDKDLSSFTPNDVETKLSMDMEIGNEDNEIPVTKIDGFFPGSVVKIEDNSKTSYGVVDCTFGDKLFLKSKVGKTYNLIDNPKVSSMEFDITLKRGTTSEKFAQLAVQPEHPRFFANLIQSQLVSVIPVNPLPNPSASENLLPELLTAKFLFGGGNDNLYKISYLEGLKPLEKVEGISLLAIPGQTDVIIQGKMIDHCKFMRYRFAILDSRLGADTDGVLSQRNDLGTTKGFAAIYYPWIQSVDLETREVLTLPPSGAIAGIYARSDSERGVHKAPANEKVAGAIGLERKVSKGEQEVLNPEAVNVIRFFPGKGNLVWGARTLASDPSWKYVNVRRLFLYLEESIERATQWAVFEPNDEKLWARVKQTVTQFLTTVWKDGALMGSTPEEAFFVRCDRTTMTQNDIDNGRLIVLIGAAPVKPAEFVIFRIAQWQGGAETSE